MTAVVYSSFATAVAVWLRRPDDWVVVRLRLGLPGGQYDRWAPPTSLVAVAATCAVVVAVPSTATQIAVVAMIGAGLFALKLRRGARRRADATRFRGEVARVVRAASAELRAGIDPAAALHAATSDASDAWLTVRSAGAADVTTALQAAAATPGGDSLTAVAAAWHLAEQSGAPLAVILDRMAASIQDEVDLDREVAVEAGPARATARLMAVLPLFGLGLGLLLGVNPVAVLLGSGLGVACLTAGLALACGGVWWIERIVSSLERPPSTRVQGGVPT
jgi:tight adherence protein B